MATPGPQDGNGHVGASDGGTRERALRAADIERLRSSTAAEPWFGRLALLFSSPSVWQPGHADRLRAFVLALMDRDQPGMARLGTLSMEDDLPTWLDPGDVTARVDELHEATWLPADGVAAPSETESQRQFELLMDARAVLFLDRTRFEACYEARTGNAVDRDSSPDPYWVGLTIDWARYGSALTLYPQFRVWSYWPESPTCAPPPSSPVSPSALSAPPLDPAASANVLEMLYWRDIETRMRHLRSMFGLDNAVTGGYESPVFYMAEPLGPPLTPEDYLTTGWVSTLVPLTEKTLGLVDPLADKAATAILQGRFMVLSTALASRSRQRQDYYLMLPSRGTDVGQPRDERLVLLADQLSYIYFRASLVGSRVEEDSDVLTQQISLEAAILGHAGETADRILTVVSAPGRGPRRGERSMRELTREFQLVVERMRLKFDQIDLEIRGARANLEHSTASDAEEMTNRLTIRSTGTGRRLSGETLSPSVIAGRALERLRRSSEAELLQLERLKTTFEGVLAHVEKAERESDERGQKTSGYLLGFLAAVVAFPLLIGHMSWGEMSAVLGDSGVARAFREAHTTLTWISIAATVAGILATGWYLLMRSPRLRRASGLLSLHRSTTREPRKEIASVWLRFSEAEERAQQTQDQEVLDALAAEAAWLLEHELPLPDGSSMAGLRSRVRVLGALTELFLHRPQQLPLPATVLFLSTCGRRFFPEWGGASAVSSMEVQYALLVGGYGHEQASRITEIAASYEWLAAVQTVAGLVQAIRELLAAQPRASQATEAEGPPSEPQPQPIGT